MLKIKNFPDIILFQQKKLSYSILIIFNFCLFLLYIQSTIEISTDLISLIIFVAFTLISNSFPINCLYIIRYLSSLYLIEYFFDYFFCVYDDENFWFYEDVYEGVEHQNLLLLILLFILYFNFLILLLFKLFYCGALFSCTLLHLFLY